MIWLIVITAWIAAIAVLVTVNRAAHRKHMPTKPKEGQR